jgi:hypothetical protein
MSDCPCGAAITWATADEFPGRVFPLDHTATYRGIGRWRVKEYGRPWLVEPVDANADVAAYADHRLVCPLVSAADKRALEQALRGDDDGEAMHDGPAAGERGPAGPR